jgi:ankyrin repeat protein
MCNQPKAFLCIALFLSLALQSCTVGLGPKLSYAPPATALPTKDASSLLSIENQEKNSFPRISLKTKLLSEVFLKPASSKVALPTFTAYSGETVTFLQDQGIWTANVQGWWQELPPTTPNASPMLRVVAENSTRDLNTILQILAKQPPKVHKHRIHLIHDQHSKHIFVGALGLLGGMLPEEKESKQDPASTSPLHKAASQGNCQVIKQLLESGANPNQVHAGTTPLYWAAKNQHVAAAQLLLEHNAEPNLGDKYGYTPLYFAAECGLLNLVQLLLEKHANPNMVDESSHSPLYWSSQKGYYKIVNLLLQKGAYPNIANKFGYTPLHQAVENGRCKIVETLLQHSANPNTKDQDGDTPLYIAAEKGDVRLVTLLLANNAQPNQADMVGCTPLCCAAKHGYAKVVQLLLSNGANPNQADNLGNTPLHQAAMHSHIKTMNKLLQAQANIILPNNNGDTFLHILAAQTPGLLLKTIKTIKGINKVFLGTIQEFMQHACPELLDEAKDILAIVIDYREDLDWSLRNNQGKSIEDLLEEANNQRQAKNILQQIAKYKRHNGYFN